MATCTRDTAWGVSALWVDLTCTMCEYDLGFRSYRPDVGAAGHHRQRARPRICFKAKLRYDLNGVTCVHRPSPARRESVVHGFQFSLFSAGSSSVPAPLRNGHETQQSFLRDQLCFGFASICCLTALFPQFTGIIPG